jgi:sulfatase maturation enzyme AslB (radical SAM superfamily)
MTPLNVLSSRDSTQRDPASVAEIPLLRLDWLWLYNPGTACNLACNHCLTLSSPSSKVLLPLETSEVKRALEEAKEATGGGFNIGMTGGEVFLLAQNKYQQRLFDQIEICLNYGPLLILTNAILASDEELARLKTISDAAPFDLKFRVSLDGPSAEANDKIRTGLNGAPTYDSIIAGLQRFVKAGFMPTIAYTYSNEGGPAKVASNLEAANTLYLEALKSAGLPELELWGIPIFDQGEEFKRREKEGVEHIESPGITNHCISHYLKNAFHDFQCSYSRAFCKEPTGETGWYKCAVLPAEGVEKGSRISSSLKDAMGPIELPHTQCITCFRSATSGCAMSCSGE